MKKRWNQMGGGQAMEDGVGSALIMARQGRLKQKDHGHLPGARLVAADGPMAP